MPSPADLRAEAARLESEAAALRTRAKKLRRFAATMEVVERELAGGGLGVVDPPVKNDGLRPTRDERIVSSVNVQARNLSGDTKRAAGRATRKGKAQKRLYEKNETIAGLAKKLGEGRARVSKWFGDEDENRPIPRKIAERLREDYGIPLSDWSRIAD